MTPERTLAAVSRLADLASDYPELSTGLTGLISGLLNRPSIDDQPNKPVGCNNRSNGHIDTSNGIARTFVAENKDHKDSKPGPVCPRNRHPRIARDQTFLDGDTSRLEWYSPDEVAGIFGKCHDTVYLWIRKGYIHAEKNQGMRVSAGVRNGGWMIHVSEIERINKSGLRQGYGDRDSTNRLDLCL